MSNIKAPKLFKPEDFLRALNPEHSLSILSPYERTALIAQQIFEAWLAEQPVVYSLGELGQSSWDHFKDFSKDIKHDHTAQLVNIQPLAKEACEHEPKLVDLSLVIESGFLNQHQPKNTQENKATLISPECHKCNKKLKAVWTAEET